MNDLPRVEPPRRSRVGASETLAHRRAARTILRAAHARRTCVASARSSRRDVARRRDGCRPVGDQAATAICRRSSPLLRWQSFARSGKRPMRIEIGAAVTYSEALDALTCLHPDFGELLRRLGSVQVRNAGTIGGNIANGSPIGDTPPPLIALGATLVLGKRRRPAHDSAGKLSSSPTANRIASPANSSRKSLSRS